MADRSIDTGRAATGRLARAVPTFPGLTLDAANVEWVQGVTMNVGQDLIVITRDKVELCLIKHASGLEQRKAWLVPFGVLLSLLLTLVTSDPHDWLGVPKDTWRAVFVLLAIVALGWLIKASLAAFKAKTVPDVIAELQAESKRQAKQTHP